MIWSSTGSWDGHRRTRWLNVSILSSSTLFPTQSRSATHHQALGNEALRVHKKILESIYTNDIDTAKEIVSESIDVWEKLQ